MNIYFIATIYALGAVWFASTDKDSPFAEKLQTFGRALVFPASIIWDRVKSWIQSVKDLEADDNSSTTSTTTTVA